jgi:hypothetical protein
MGLSEGWLADQNASPATADEVAAHYSEISSTAAFSVPLSARDEIGELWTRLGLI